MITVQPWLVIQLHAPIQLSYQEPWEQRCALNSSQASAITTTAAAVAPARHTISDNLTAVCVCGGLSLSRSQPKAGASHSTKGPLQSLKASTDPSHSLVSPTPAHPADTSGPTGQLPTITSNQIRPIERCAALASAAYHLLAPGISLLPYKHQHTCQFSFIWLPNTVHHSDAPTRQAVRITWLREHFSLSESLWSSRSSAWLRQASRARDWGERLWLGAWRCKFGMRWMEGWRCGGTNRKTVAHAAAQKQLGAPATC